MPCRPYAPKPFCLAPTLSLLWGARHGGSTRGGCHFEKVRCRCPFLEASGVVVTGEGGSSCLSLVLVLCLCHGLCRRVGNGNGLAQPLAPAGLHIACHLQAQASYLLFC